MSMGLCNPNFDFCIIYWANVHRIPLEMDAINKKQKPRALNCVDLYVNMHKPDDISTTIVISDQLCAAKRKWIKKNQLTKFEWIFRSRAWLTFFSSPNNMAKKQMNIIVVDLVIVYLDKNDYAITSLIIYEFNFNFSELWNLSSIHWIKIEPVCLGYLYLQWNRDQFESPVGEANINSSGNTCWSQFSERFFPFNVHSWFSRKAFVHNSDNCRND